MNTDKLIRDVFPVLKNIKWNDCEDGEFKWYYAEDCHYVIASNKTGAIWFVKAKSPQKAVECVIGKINS